jgi:hypothetical protein
MQKRATIISVTPITSSYYWGFPKNEPIKSPQTQQKQLHFFYGKISEQGTRGEFLWGLRWVIFLRLVEDLETSAFFKGLVLLILFYTKGERKGVFWATAEEKTRACWHQVNKERLHALQTSSGWSVH